MPENDAPNAHNLPGGAWGTRRWGDWAARAGLQTGLDWLGAWSTGVPIGEVLRTLRVARKSSATLRRPGEAGSAGAMQGRRLLNEDED
jgi:hypothetical protein